MVDMMLKIADCLIDIKHELYRISKKLDKIKEQNEHTEDDESY